MWLRNWMKLRWIFFRSVSPLFVEAENAASGRCDLAQRPSVVLGWRPTLIPQPEFQSNMNMRLSRLGFVSRPCVLSVKPVLLEEFHSRDVGQTCTLKAGSSRVQYSLCCIILMLQCSIYCPPFSKQFYSKLAVVYRKSYETHGPTIQSDPWGVPHQPHPEALSAEGCKVRILNWDMTKKVRVRNHYFYWSKLQNIPSFLVSPSWASKFIRMTLEISAEPVMNMSRLTSSRMSVEYPNVANILAFIIEGQMGLKLHHQW